MQNGPLGLELPYITVRTFKLIVPLSTVGQVQASWSEKAKDAINVKDLVPGLVKINQCRTSAVNVEFLEESASTITEAYGLPKSMQFNDDPCAIKD